MSVHINELFQKILISAKLSKSSFSFQPPFILLCHILHNYHQSIFLKIKRITILGASLVVQWLRIHLVIPLKFSN